SKDSERLLLESSRYVILKRFTSKEEKRRIVAAVFSPTDSYSKWLGLENHLNYIHRKNGKIPNTEALGLAAFLNSVIADRYFRAISGNTQINAAEIREMPFPEEEDLVRIGSAIETMDKWTPVELEQIVAHALNLPKKLIQNLTESIR
ncbi:MAG: restriction endonuclease, partial [Candidatus Omnitrophica bacterium]|nr:restriction endonuclease [Candidatus Omnitrophota bacterium]